MGPDCAGTAYLRGDKVVIEPPRAKLRSYHCAEPV